MPCQSAKRKNAEAKDKHAKEMEQIQKLKQKEIENAVKKALEEAAKPKEEEVSDTQPVEADKKPTEEDS
jgi:hypothetical protein